MSVLNSNDPKNTNQVKPMDTIKPLFTAVASTTGGRNGHTEAADHTVKADLSVPKEMGGPGKPGTTTPEHLFAAGYSACFGGAVDFVAKPMGAATLYIDELAPELLRKVRAAAGPAR